MATFSKHDVGTFSWVDLGTSDADAAKRFYGTLFGWTFDDMPAGPGNTYSMAKLGDRVAAGLYKMGADMTGVPPHWLPYVTVTDVAATAKKATAAGGKLLKEPFDVMTAGRMAVITDPTGATFAAWQPKDNPGAGVKMETGAVCWNELATTNVDRARAFYTQTFGWKATAMDMSAMQGAGTYTLFAHEGAPKDVNDAGMMAFPPNMQGVPSNWLTYFAVDDCDASVKKALELGGKTIMPATDIPTIGRFAILQDPQGAVFAIIKPMPRA